MSNRKFKNVQGLELFQLAAKATENKDLPLALEYFDEIVTRTGSKSALPLLSRATCYTELKQFEKCVEDCQKILKLPSIPIQEDLVKGSTNSHSAAYSRLNNAYKELNMTDKAGEALKKRADIESAARKEAYERNKKTIQTEGEPKIQEVIEDEDEEDKKFTEELNKKIKEFKTRGKDLFLQKRYEDASKVYKIALQLDEDDHILHGNLSGCYIQLGKFDDALYHANECVRINGNWAKGYYRQGKYQFITFI
jgi:tetratricopeptide (TPR) repeat protein